MSDGGPARGRRKAERAAKAEPQPGSRRKHASEADRPDAFPPTVGEFDLHLFAEGRHLTIDRLLGAHVRTLDGVPGVSFAVWAPGARRVSVVGDFCGWDEGLALRPLGASGVHERFVPGLPEGTLYKYRIETASGEVLVKTDPYATLCEPPPNHAAIVVGPSRHAWGDDAWMSARTRRDPLREPMSVYEVHVGSWVRVPEEGHRSVRWRELAPHLAKHVRELGFTHVELMPVMEHPFGGSWGYQVTGYFAPCSRYGGPDDLRFLVDTLHQAGLGVILDWVPAHFPDDEHALARFDGSALYEHEDPRRGRHPDWDTLIFNYGRHEVANFLLASALHWLREYHADGLRVDAVASMLLLDYSRKDGEWLPNPHGGRENLEAVAFLRTLNETVRARFPGVVMVAEESTTWPGVTRPVGDGGLGFHLKWNLGWMHDTLEYFATDPLFRQHQQDKLTFSIVYEWTEHFLMPLSHDEVVHGKGSLLGRMFGDEWQKFANLRALLAYQFTRPGKKLLFMGTELASLAEWNHDGSLDWHLRDDRARQGLTRLLGALGSLYRGHPCLWANDTDADGFRWIDCTDRVHSVLVYERRHGDDRLVVVLNLTPVPRDDYRVGVPLGRTWRRVLDSDETAYGGSGYPSFEKVRAEDVAWHGQPASVVLRLPPLSALVLEPEAAPEGDRASARPASEERPKPAARTRSRARKAARKR